MLYKLCVAALAAQATALQMGPTSTETTSRRALLSRVAATLPAIAALPALAGPNDGLQGGKFVDEWGAALPSKSYLSTSGYANTAGRRNADIRLGGKYTDPNHPGCFRKVTLIGTNKVLVDGADEDKVPWKVRGTYSGNTVTLDFTPKGGPKDVTAVYTISGGLKFPDGNAWKKV